MSSSIDIALLQKVRHHSNGKVTARCPACAESGSDRTGNHLAIFPDGRFACAAHAGDHDHRKRIFALAGRPDHLPPPDPIQRQRIGREKIHHQLRTQASRQLNQSARRNRQQLISANPWNPEDVWQDSPQRIDGDLTASCPRHFLATLFANITPPHPPNAGPSSSSSSSHIGGAHADAPSSSSSSNNTPPSSPLLWTGQVHQSGQPTHAFRWKTLSDWQTTHEPIGPMTTPAIWQPGTHSRSAANVLTAPYTVLDFDGFDGIKPTTPEELQKHLHASLAIIRWLRDRQHWHLAAILHTGGKSLHAWFHTPPKDILATLKTTAPALGIDESLIGSPEHPCRLPGMIHQGTGQTSRVMWLRISSQ